MYTKKVFSAKDVFLWTRKDIYKFLIIALIPVFLYACLHFKWLHLPWLPIALIGTAVAFIIGFKNNASYGRLWEARQIWGGIVNSSRSFTLMVNDFINNEHAIDKKTNEELVKIRKTLIHRHIAWMTAHRYSLRQAKPWESSLNRSANREYLEKYDIEEWRIPFEEAVKPYLNSSDFNYIQNKTNKAAALLKLQSNHLRELKEEKLIWEFSHLEMENQLVEFFALQGKNERIKNFPYPRQFATLNYYFVWLFIFLLPFGVMSEFDNIGLNLYEQFKDNNENPFNFIYLIIAQNFIWLSVPFSVIVSWVFYSMERIGEVSENPFEGTVNDVPITTIARGIEIDIREMIDENKEDIPLPITMKNDTQS